MTYSTNRVLSIKFCFVPNRDGDFTGRLDVRTDPWLGSTVHLNVNVSIWRETIGAAALPSVVALNITDAEQGVTASGSEVAIQYSSLRVSLARRARWY
jgi:hypothetical protein